MVSVQVVLKAMCATSVLVSTQRTGLIEVFSHENVANNHVCMTAEVIMDLYAGCTFYLTIESFDKVDVNWRKREELGEVADEPQEIVQNKGECYSYIIKAKETTSDSPVSAVHYKLTPDRSEQMAER